jgi:hypothetical protein
MNFMYLSILGPYASMYSAYIHAALKIKPESGALVNNSIIQMYVTMYYYYYLFLKLRSYRLGTVRLLRAPGVLGRALCIFIF